MKLYMSWDVRKKVQARAELALEVVGGLAVTAVTDQIRKNGSVVTSNLVNSIVFSTSKQSFAPTKTTTGLALYKADRLTIKVGSTVVYAPRVEFGFNDTDSLGRVYHQPPKSYLRVAMKKNKKKLRKIFQEAIKNAS